MVITVVLVGRRAGRDHVGEELLEGLWKYARETEYEKIRQGIATTAALFLYRKKSAADITLKAMMADHNPIL